MHKGNLLVVSCSTLPVHVLRSLYTFGEAKLKPSDIMSFKKMDDNAKSRIWAARCDRGADRGGCAGPCPARPAAESNAWRMHIHAVRLWVESSVGRIHVGQVKF